MKMNTQYTGIQLYHGNIRNTCLCTCTNPCVYESYTQRLEYEMKNFYNPAYLLTISSPNQPIPTLVFTNGT